MNTRSDVRLPDHQELPAPVTILDGQGRVVRVVPAAEFRRARVGSVRPTVGNGLRGKVPAKAAITNVMLAMVMGSLLLAPIPVPAQETTPPHDRPIVHPAPAAKDAIGEAERQLMDLETLRREQQLLDAGTPSTPQRPNLGEDVTAGIQQRAIRNVVPR